MSEFDLNILCPSCEKSSRLATPIGAQGVACPHCRAFFSKNAGFLDLLPHAPSGRNAARMMMEWPRLITAYEGKYWRRSFFAALSFGITFSDEFDLIIKAADLSGAEIILDLACGPGIYTRPWARMIHKGFAVGLDLSKPMLKYAAAKAEEEGIENILYVHASALSIPFSDESFDRVNCCGALHLFPDIAKALEEIHRVMKPEGIFTSASYRNWAPGKVFDRIVAWQKRNMGVTYFRRHELTTYFKDAGFDEINTLHAKRYWFIMSAVKH